MKMNIRFRLFGAAFGLVFGFFVQYLRSLQTAKQEVREYLHQFEKYDEVSIADQKSPDKVLCWMPMLTVSDVLRARILSTWGRRCNKLYFVTKEGELADGIIAHHYERHDKFDLWNQVHRGWARIAEMHMEDYEWFIKLDSDSYFNVDNFRGLVHEKNWTAESILYVGRTIFEQSRRIEEVRAQFNLGAGYGVSRKLLRLIYPFLPTAVNSTLPASKRCPEWQRWGEDVKFADCLRYLYPNLLPNATRDAFDRESFLPLPPFHHILMLYPPWVYRGQEHFIPKHHGPKCCSSRPVLWHGLKEDTWFFALDYFSYGVAVDPFAGNGKQ